MADDERQCPVCSAVFATDAALGSHLAVCVGRARAEAKRPPPRTEDDVDDARDAAAAALQPRRGPDAGQGDPPGRRDAARRGPAGREPAPGP